VPVVMIFCELADWVVLLAEHDGEHCRGAER
jgi:Fe-S-cluster formation regulator IscX/YfhJ